MATDHRGRNVHAGKRTYDMNYALHMAHADPMRGKTFDVTDPETQRAYHDAVDTLERSKTASFFDPYQNPTNMWSTSSGISMMKRVFEDPDTAHISLSNDEYL